MESGQIWPKLMKNKEVMDDLAFFTQLRMIPFQFWIDDHIG